MIRQFLSLSVIFILIALSIVSVSAMQCSFSLSDASVRSGRLFDISFSVKSKEKIASFIAEYTFDSEYLKFDSCKALDEGTIIEVNQKGKGRITVVFLCREGAASMENQPLLALTFKGLREGSTEVICDVSQIIDTDYEAVSVISCKSAEINILSPDKDTTEHKTTVVTTENVTNKYTESGITVIESDFSKSEIIIFAILTVLCLVSAVGFIAYKAGKRNIRKKDRNEK